MLRLLPACKMLAYYQISCFISFYRYCIFCIYELLPMQNNYYSNKKNNKKIYIYIRRQIAKFTCYAVIHVHLITLSACRISTAHSHCACSCAYAELAIYAAVRRQVLRSAVHVECEASWISQSAN